VVDEVRGISDDLPQPEYPPLRLTGERTLPGIDEENYWFQRHLVAYRFILPFVRGKRVADLGCGEGYGVDLLATSAREAVGVDLAPEAVYHARRKYRRPNLSFRYADIYDTGLEGGSFQAVVSLQVIEHLHQPDRFMREVLRLLEPGGLFIVTTPNREILSPGSDKPVNPFHIFEFDGRQFEEYLGRFFPQVELWGLFHAGMLQWHERVMALDRHYWRFRLPTPLNRLIYGRLFIPSLRTRHFAWRQGNLEKAQDFMGFCFKES
jgi:SAM-dependent methyltransferase